MLYEIWQTKRTPYALVDVLSALIYYRDEVISTDLPKLQRLCDRLNFMAGEDEHYEIREARSHAVCDQEQKDRQVLSRKR